ncbi:MAG: SWIM zinc finger family protein [Myxacorys californica WJT36-NPBG1]|jgi:uncharacterized Zn finger protein|nr:SWIM zinc finger family protein [Myxacorys californica WJT36-NPBG1]
MVAPISEIVISHHATSNSFSRGEDYYHRSAVIDLVQRGNTIHAEVEGSEVTPYRVSLQFDSGGITSVRCTCPYDYEGWCKHIVAVALTWVRQPDRLELRPTLPQLLDRLDHLQTQRLVQALVAEQPELIDAVDRQVMLMSNPASSTPMAAPQRRSTLDVAPFRRQVKQILQEGVRSLEEGYEDDPFTDDLLGIIEKAQAFARNEDGNSAIAILEAITAACVDEWDDIQDYGGDAFPIAESLNEAWTEAILSADLSPPEAVDLRVMLEEWQDALDSDFSMSLVALQQGWTDPDLLRALQGNGYADPERLNSPFAQELALIRLQILNRQERQTEYLNLARTEGLTAQYLTRLAEIGNIDEAMTVARDRMTTAEEAFALAKTLREQNYLSEALTIAQAGLPLPGNCRYALASWTSELAEGLGNREAALDASVLAFKLRPSFPEYQRVAHLAAAQWEGIKSDLLKTLRQSQDWQAREAKVDIFLHEGLLDDAIEAVRSDHYYRSELVHRVMQAAVFTHPDWVIKAALERAEPIMEQGKADRYQEAVQWLQHAKAAYIQSEQQSVWMIYFNQLQSNHARKRKLMDLFKQLL